jgi:hypothetical protein
MEFHKDTWKFLTKPSTGGTTRAEVLYGQLIEQIIGFEEPLTQEQEIGVYLVATPLNAVATSNVEFQNPNMLVFVGRDLEGGPHRVIQHCTQLSVSLCAVKKENTTEAPRRIGLVPLGEFHPRRGRLNYPGCRLNRSGQTT